MKIVGALMMWLVGTTASAAGFAMSDNFTVFTGPSSDMVAGSNEFAQQVLTKAEEMRKTIALEWLSHELSKGKGRTTIKVFLNSKKTSGLFWANTRGDHNIYVTTPLAKLDEVLQHEMAHVVLATAYPNPNRLPRWIEEGIACRYDTMRRDPDSWQVKAMKRMDVIIKRHGKLQAIQKALEVSNGE